MERLSLGRLEADAEPFNAYISNMEGIDAFCSSSYWGVAAATGLMGEREEVLFVHDAGYVTLMKNVYPDGLRVLEPLEAMWGLGASVIGDAQKGARALKAVLGSLTDSWDALVLTGYEKTSPHFRALVEVLAKDHQLRLGADIGRHQANLRNGFEDYWSKRTRQHRKNLRRIEKNMPFEIEGVVGTDLDKALLRMVDVERRSWKGIERVGMEAGQLIDFYKKMLSMMWPKGMGRLLFIKDGDLDVAFVLGAILGKTYRGLQFAFDDTYKKYGLGHFCQVAQLKRLPGDVHIYDLGTEGLEYKKKWSDTVVRTNNLHVFR